MTPLVVTPVDGIGEVTEGTDLAELITDHSDVQDGDVVVVTSKVVSKAEGRVRGGDRDTLLAGETDRVVARRGPTTIVRTRHGLVMAAAGIDASNTPRGTVVLLPVDPDGSARRIREQLRARSGRNVAVVVSDTSGRAWRTGQTDIAVGAAGLEVLEDHGGRTDPYGNPLVVTAPAVADEIAAAADLVTGKVARLPAAILRGAAARVLPPGEHGPGAAALVRGEADDLFGYGAREAVLHAVAPGDGRGFGECATPEELVAALQAALGGPAVASAIAADRVEVRLLSAEPREQGRAEALVTVLARAHRWEIAADTGDDRISFRPALP